MNDMEYTREASRLSEGKQKELDAIVELYKMDGYFADELAFEDLEQIETNIANDHPIFMGTRLDIGAIVTKFRRKADKLAAMLLKSDIAPDSVAQVLIGEGVMTPKSIALFKLENGIGLTSADREVIAEALRR